MAVHIYTGAPGAVESPLPIGSYFCPHRRPIGFAQQGGFEPHRPTETIHPLIFVPRILLGTPGQVEGLLPADFLQHPGAYLLLRPGSVLDRPEVRVGEGRNVAERLRQSRESWIAAGYSLVIAITCDHPSFNKEAAETAELRLTAMIESHSSIRVMRDRAPKVRALDLGTQRAIDDMLAIVCQELQQRGITILSPGLAVTTRAQPIGSLAPTFVPPEAVKTPAGAGDMLFRSSVEISHDVNVAPIMSPHGEPGIRKSRRAPWRATKYTLHYGALDGSMVKREPDLFEIEAGTQVSATEVAALHQTHRKLRDALIAKGNIGPDPDRINGLVVVRPIIVKSGAKAAAIVTGSTKSPTRVWRAA